MNICSPRGLQGRKLDRLKGFETIIRKPPISVAWTHSSSICPHRKTRGSTLVFSQTRVIYAGNGVARGGSNGTFTLCDSRGATSAKGLIIGPSGRPRHAMDSDANGILQDGNNLDLVC